ncbi:hypothetical protein RS3R6_12960 [Pseudomonas atacamensis]|uniref:Uncharacterized protein n=1 Tax=Pseudomonas atacamensis TaxID=2565368 RepID=A0ABQ5PKY6_9PSED|nr:hypothetical protein RS3R1_33130 [Pseudomonas atacamensis]GLH53115.1 hypothetical protein RS3R6_12960 [Pseudomonas atacamensis]
MRPMPVVQANNKKEAQCTPRLISTSPRGTVFSSSPSMACKGLTHILQPLETVEADTCNPGNRHADQAGLAAGG